jgi:hypothetical protein
MPRKQNAIFNELIFMNLTDVQWHNVGISSTKFHPNWPRNMESISKKFNWTLQEIMTVTELIFMKSDKYLGQ